MTPRIEVVQRVEDQSEGLEPIDIELRVFDVGMMSLELNVRVKLYGALFSNLRRL
jgi:hypothetical protein